MSSPAATPATDSGHGAIVDAGALVDYAKTLDCIHCGLCLQTCPTFRLSGAEASSPRGRIHLMRAVGEGRLEADESYADELDFCLLCRHCESVCPAGVRFGDMMEFARDQIGTSVPRKASSRFARWAGFRVLLPSRFRLRLMGSLLRFGQVTGILGLAARFLGRRGEGLRDLPRVPALSVRRLLPPRVRADARSAAVDDAERVLVLQGCVMPEFFSHVNRATVESLAHLGVESEIPDELVCCGSLHAHNGDREGARSLARRMIEIFERTEDRPVVVNSAGCGAHMRELHHLFATDDPWHARASALAKRVVDYAEFVAPRLDRSTGAWKTAQEIQGPVTWDDPCHLCHAQGIREEPRRILGRLARETGFECVELPDSESCCGSAGIYSLLRPEDSAAVFARKLDALEKCGARTLVTANPGCQLQWESGLRRAGREVRVVHLAQLVAALQCGRE